MIRPLLAIAALATALPAAAQQSGTAWRSGFHQGIAEYLTGEWDSSTGGALNLSCQPGGRVAILAQIKGQAPPANAILQLTTSSRAGSRDFRFATDGKGGVTLPATGAAFRPFWAALRTHDIVTVRYPDGRFSVRSLDGAGATLPAMPCG